jgi:DUF971 family protein
VSAAAGIRIRRDTNRLELTFEDGRLIALPAEFLRVMAPAPPGKSTPLLGGKRRVGLLAAQPVGNYALRLQFSDGFDGGIYSWDFLEELGREQSIRWRRYLRLLEDAGMSRD